MELWGTAANRRSALTCKNVRVGAPKKTEFDVLTVALRKKFDLFAVQLDVSRDLENDVTGIHLPVFVSVEKAQNLETGIAFDWKSDTKDIVTSFFVSKPFTFF